MSGTEDYLDGLLNSLDADAIPQDTETEKEPREADLADAENSRKDETGAGEDYLESLEKDILSGDSPDDFIRQFEEELEQEGVQEADTADPLEDDNLFGSLDEIVNSVKERMQDDIMVDTLGDIPGMDIGMPAVEEEASDTPENMEEELFGAPSEMEDDTVPAGAGGTGFGDDDPEFAELFRTDGELPDIEELLGKDFGEERFSGEEPEELYGGESEFPVGSLEEILGMDEVPAQPAADELPEQEPDQKKKEKKKDKAEKKEKVDKKAQKKEKGESSGFFGKLSSALFEENGEDEQPAAEEPKKVEMSDENLQILQQLEGDTVVDLQQEKKAADEEKAKKKEAAKKARKEKKEQAKKEREAKKKSKPKKEKKPKQPDKSKPLPKKPVFLIFLMTGSFLALVLFGIKFSGYAGNRSRAAEYYARGEYAKAYQELSGLELADDDKDTYEKYRILANAAGEFDAYGSLMDAKIYDMALDSLIRTVGRCERYRSDAHAYGCAGELDGVKNRAVGVLAEFGVSEERALELYTLEDRSVYSAQLYRILAEAGYETK